MRQRQGGGYGQRARKHTSGWEEDLWNAVAGHKQDKRLTLLRAQCLAKGGLPWTANVEVEKGLGVLHKLECVQSLVLFKWSMHGVGRRELWGCPPPPLALSQGTQMSSSEMEVS